MWPMEPSMVRSLFPSNAQSLGLKRYPPWPSKSRSVADQNWFNCYLYKIESVYINCVGIFISLKGPLKTWFMECKLGSYRLGWHLVFVFSWFMLYLDLPGSNRLLKSYVHICIFYLPGSPNYTMYAAFLYITPLQTSQWIKKIYS